MTVILVANGEIYNDLELKEKYFSGPNEMDRFASNSDCEIILHMYEKFGEDFMMMNEIKGMFAFVLHDTRTNTTVVARDHIGVIPLYYGRDAAGSGGRHGVSRSAQAGEQARLSEATAGISPAVYGVAREARRAKAAHPPGL